LINVTELPAPGKIPLINPETSGDAEAEKKVDM
jgi:hypothetical protein